MTFLTSHWPEVIIAFALAIALMVGLWIPYFIKEIRDGKRELGPLRRLTRGNVRLGGMTPTGAGDNNPGRVGDPAPGQPDAQPDPYGPRGQRHGPPIHS